MKSRLIRQRQPRGYIALIAVVLISLGCFAISLSTLVAAKAYSDQVTLKEYRIQGRFNLTACLDQAILILTRDFNYRGNLYQEEFVCDLTFSSLGINQALVTAQIRLGTVLLNSREILQFGSQEIQIISRTSE